MIAKYFLFLCLWLTCSAWGSIIHSSSFETNSSVKIHSPLSGDDITSISDLTDIFITVSDTNLAGWRLSLRDESRKDSPYLTLVSGSTERNNELIGQLDPTRFENGIYSLNLQATDKGGNANSHKMYVLFTGQMKLGHFGLTFNDVSMDTVGIPLSMQRTYDTRRRQIGGDFGNGWTMAYNNIRLSENGKFGRNWIYQQFGSLLNRRYCSYRNNGDGYVSITTPDGETHNFRAVAEPECTSVQQPWYCLEQVTNKQEIR